MACTECRGSGKYVGLNITEPCRACGPTSYKIGVDLAKPKYGYPSYEADIRSGWWYAPPLFQEVKGKIAKYLQLHSVFKISSIPCRVPDLGLKDLIAAKKVCSFLCTTKTVWHCNNRTWKVPEEELGNIYTLVPEGPLSNLQVGDRFYHHKYRENLLEVAERGYVVRCNLISNTDFSVVQGGWTFPESNQVEYVRMS